MPARKLCDEVDVGIKDLQAEMESTLASLGDWRKQRSEGAPPSGNCIIEDDASRGTRHAGAVELEAKLKAELEEAAAKASPSKEREHWTTIVNKELDLSSLAAPEEMELKAAPALEPGAGAVFLGARRRVALGAPSDGSRAASLGARRGTALP